MDYKFFLRKIALIIFSPRKAWSGIAEENQPVKHLRNNLLLPLLLLVTICSFLGSMIFSNVTLQPVYSIFVALKYFLLNLFVVYISAVIFREITKALDLPSEFSFSFEINVYSMVPLFICQMVSLLFESFAFINILAFYGTWIFWTGGEARLNPPDYKKMPMLIATFVIIAGFMLGGGVALNLLIDRIYFSFFA
jgi:hypothetical protein